MPAIDKKTYYGKHWILAGGRGDDTCSEDGSEDDENEPVDKDDDNVVPSDPPIAHHALPIVVVSDLTKAFGVKHVIDLSPTPMPLAFDIISRGGSYVGLTASPLMNYKLKTRLFKQVILGIVNPKERLLYDSRFSADAIKAGSLIQTWRG